MGAVLVNDANHVIASGYNGAPFGQPHCDDVGCIIEGGHCVRAIHAEENAIIQCARNGVSCINAILVVTHRPCVRCVRLIIQAGIRGVLYLQPYDADGSADEVKTLLTAAHVVLIHLTQED